MTAIQVLGRRGLAGGLLATTVGLLLAVGSAVAAGDWWLARQPWIGLGLTLTVVGLAATAAFAALLDVVEPLGWARLLAVPPALFIAAFWAFMLLVGLPTTGPGVPERDVRTTLYSLPQLLVVVVMATLLIGLPLAVRRVAPRRQG
ncbi:MAG: hypothetical protein E6J17_03190 [Chloroflexi bacterium]|nr:MAG: hypothetical protein E6J17_03190 [Chloroflexota bacterium]